VYTDLPSHFTDMPRISSRAILCSRNEMVDRMNDRVLHMFPGDVVTCLSVDSVAEVDQQAVYLVEYLYFLNLNGLPPHRSNMKVERP